MTPSHPARSLLALLVIARAAATAAQGETCATATPIAPGTYTGDTTAAANDYSGTCAGFLQGPDLVYSYTPASGELVDLILTPTASDYDAGVWVFTGCATRNCVAGADAHGTRLPEKIEFLRLTGGVQYFVVADGYSDVPPSMDHGPYSLELRQSTIPDTCASARSVPMLPWRDQLDTSIGAPDLDPSPGCLAAPQAGSDVVYRVDPTYPASLEVRLEPNGFDASLYAIADCASPATSCLAGSDQAGTGGSESITVDLGPGTPVYIVVDSAGGAGGPFAITFAVGDTCPAAVPIAALPFSADGDSGALDDDLNLAGGSCTGLITQSSDVVYAISLAQDTVANLRAEPLDGNYDLSLYVVTDCAQPTATCVAGADLGVDGEPEEIRNLQVRAGQTLYAVIDSFIPGEGGFYRFTVTPSTDVFLYLVKTAAGVDLSWSGGSAPFTVIRDTSPTFPAPAQLPACAAQPMCSDAPGAGTFYYRVE